ncbi:NAD(P)H-quinone oxidoreductase [Chelatococcus asaccharovorans]|uniref:NAD(P)H-quinone oxidoreductase n=1 Tax=Chelatococcus asaccharovorans TaxID=28210 RepID=UPI00224C6B5F|nr:NAD(P)H-quinone oxidoreductase [Chelatococcus asaccharovorans]CAH1650141.1 putative PIG3 family NAD(P)H quinone oxidoreductase [Chelatococcus asaccharovorans]CAH1692071.1 putative PIG3 family NAD(P)H quinone oxidoreductase [Chelatococcus asaccharovorans]
MIDLPPDMLAVAIARPGPPEVLAPVTRRRPSPGAGEVLIRVHAAGVNRPDVLQRMGHYPPPPDASDLPGLEVAGEVVACGPGVEWPLAGEKVCALVNGGGYATYALAPAPQCLPIPSGLSMVEAAALPETFLTVWANVFARCGLKPGEIFLVHGGASGIGTTAIQVCAALGARVFATAGSAEKCDACVRLGAEHAVNYRQADFVEEIRQKTGGAGVDVILDMVGGDYTARNLRLLRQKGRIAQIYFLRGSEVTIDLADIMTKQLVLTGGTLRPRTTAEKGALALALRGRVWPLIESGAVRPVIHAALPLAEAAAAHRLMEADAHIGKIVLRAV